MVFCLFCVAVCSRRAICAIMSGDENGQVDRGVSEKKFCAQEDVQKCGER